MKIVNRKDFLKIDKPILYRVVSADFYKENYGYLPLGEPYIKYQNLSDDWFYYDLMEDIKIKGERSPIDSTELYSMMEKIKTKDLNLELDSTAQRDGFYVETDKYLIFENDDIEILIARLQRLL